jgi:hypothetical protein
MTRRLEQCEAAADEAIRLGATFDYELTNNSIVAIIGYRGKTRKVFMSNANHSNYKIRTDVRRQIEGMKG